MAKNGLNAKVIAHAKYSVWVKTLNCPKIRAKNVSTSTVTVVLCKKRLKNTANIRKMRAF